MNQRIELTIEGHGEDGQMLVVCGWPNLCTKDVPKTTNTILTKWYPAIAKDVQPPKDMTSWYVCSVLGGYLIMREYRLWKQRRRKKPSSPPRSRITGE